MDVRRVRFEHVRQFGRVYLALALGRRLGLHTLLRKLLPHGEEAVAWAATACILILLRFCAQPAELSVAERWYARLTEAEAGFRVDKSDLGLRPVFHQQAERVRVDILVCFLALALWQVVVDLIPAHQSKGGENTRCRTPRLPLSHLPPNPRPLPEPGQRCVDGGFPATARSRRPHRLSGPWHQERNRPLLRPLAQRQIPRDVVHVAAASVKPFRR